MKKGKLIVISGPSAVGKDSVVREYLKNNEGFLMVSATSRNKREGEIDGKDYFFLTKEEFEEKIQNNDFLEYATYNNNYYGTPKYKIDEYINKGINVILIIEVQGALIVKEKIKDATLIFILPPSMEELENRIRKRNLDDEENIKNRLEIAKTEIKISDKYDYKIVNDKIENVVKKLEEII